MDNPDNPYARRPFVVDAELSAQNKKTATKGLADSGCTGAYCVIDEEYAVDVCRELDIAPRLIHPPRPLRGYDGKLAKRPITQAIYPHLSVDGHRESTVPMLIAPLGQHRLILGKPWMNKHQVLLDCQRDKLLFWPGRCSHDGAKPTDLKDLPTLPPELRSPQRSPSSAKR